MIELCGDRGTYLMARPLLVLETWQAARMDNSTETDKIHGRRFFFA